MPDFQERNDSFKEIAAPGLDNLSNSELEIVWNQMRVMPKQNDIATVLDLGRANQHFTDMIRNKYTVEQLSRAPESIAHLPFPAKKYDMIVCANVLQFIQNGLLKQAASEIKRVASRYILVTVPYRENLVRESMKCPNCGELFHGRGHVQSFTMSRLKHIFHGWDPANSFFWGEPATVGIEPLYRLARFIGKPWTDMSANCPLCHKPVTIRADEDSLAVSLLSWVEREWPVLAPQWTTVLFERKN